MMRKVLKRSDLAGFTAMCLQKHSVVGPKVRHGRYVFDRIETPGELALEHDCTVSSPKKFFFPPKETLLKFTLAGDCAIVNEAHDLMLFGVHPYDLNAIRVLDDAMAYDGKPDVNYFEKRKRAVLVGVDFLPSKWNFSKHVGQSELSEKAKEITDLFLTPIGSKIVADAYTKKGEKLIADYGKFVEFTKDDLAVLEEVKRKKDESCVQNLKLRGEDLRKALHGTFDAGVWGEFAEKCFHCGSCNFVCPTCYCFDVNDDIALDAKNGTRERRWDGCMLLQFAEVAGGENFRHDRAARLRHRLMKKGAYMWEKYDGPGCVGCGRCTTACTAKINPVDVWNRIGEVLACE